MNCQVAFLAILLLCVFCTLTNIAVGDEKLEASKGETGLARDILLLRKTVVLSGKSPTRVSSVEAIEAAMRIFERLNFIGMSRKDVLWVLGDPKTLNDNALPLKIEKDSDLIYRFDSGAKTYDGIFKFKDGNVTSAGLVLAPY